MGSGGFRPAGGCGCPRGRTASPRSPRGGGDAGMRGSCRQTGAGAAGALPVPAARSARSGGSAGRRAGSSRSVRGAPGSGNSPPRGTALPGVRYGLPAPLGTSCPGLGLRGLSRTLRSPPRVSRAGPCARDELTGGETCWGPGSGRRTSTGAGAVAPSDSAELREFVSCGFASGMYLPWPGSCAQDPHGGAGKRSLLAFPAAGWN